MSNQKIVCLDCGHAINTPGKRTPDDEREWSLNNKIGVEVIKHLKNSGVKVVRTDDPTGKTDVSLSKRVQIEKSANADCFVSIHHNALSGKWFNGGGTETYFYQGSKGSEKLAKSVHGKVVKAFGERDRGLKNGNWLYVVKNTKSPAILVEVGFMDSRQDIKKIRDDKTNKEVSKAIARGICEYLGVTFKEHTNTKKQANNDLFRVIEDGKQTGAYRDPILAIRNAIKRGSKDIKIERIEK